MKILMRSVVSGVVSLPHRAALQDPWNRTHTSLSTQQPLKGLRIVSQEVMGYPVPGSYQLKPVRGAHSFHSPSSQPAQMNARTLMLELPATWMRAGQSHYTKEAKAPR